jgi:hypothetical protein
VGETVAVSVSVFVMEAVGGIGADGLEIFEHPAKKSSTRIAKMDILVFIDEIYC